ncbi:MAG: MOSC domain-containing protein [Hyphomicrobiales bacterium]|nr:MOSC domain-containing protein [Hyphomicrobiales bacterium]
MRLGKIYRYPIKGFTPQQIDGGRLSVGAGLPFDRYCGFTCGNLPDQPAPGVWVPARTFLQLTFFPEVAKLTASFDDADRSIVITAPDGQSATAALDEPDGFAGVNDLIRSRFEPGPHAIPELHVQAPGHGNWDFTDTAVSIINLASVRELSRAAGMEVDPLRFRGNLLLEDLPAWAEFAMIGRRYRIGDAEIEVMRPARRCAATTVDPATADTAVNVPAILRKLTGHIYCGVYARVVRTGDIGENDALEDLGPWDGDPHDNLPGNVPDAQEWPRFVRLAEPGTGTLTFQNLSENWPLKPGSTGNEIRIHPVAGDPATMIRLKLVADADAETFTCQTHEAASKLSDGAWVLASGPYSV